jgi:hypothetical protein
MKKWLFIFICLLIQTLSFSNDSLRVRWKGYVKNMQTMVFPGNHFVLMDNLVHHRFDISWDISGHLSISGSARNRIFLGNLKALNPDFGKQIQLYSDDWLPLSVLWYDKGHSAFHTTADRLYAEWNKGKWNIKAGRQRINWGMNLAFNPNDIFNAYNFLDFDYEERPGVDALRVQYYTGDFSGLDLAVKGGDSLQAVGVALRWFFNTRGYDIQILSGISNGDFCIGTGWAGNIGNAGWKGEMTYFSPVNNQGAKRSFSASAGVDYTFGSGWFFYGAYLYSQAQSSGNQNIFLRQDRLTARNLYPFEHNFLTQLSYQISPMFSLSGSIIYSWDNGHPLVFNPGLRVNLSDRWDLDIIGQYFIPLADHSTLDDVSILFVRIKMSY